MGLEPTRTMASPLPSPSPVPPQSTDGPTPSVGLRIAGLLVDTGALNAEQLALASRIHKKVQASRTLSSVLIELKFVTEAQIRSALRTGSIQAPIGEVLVELGRLEPHELQLALAQQRQHPQIPLEDILVDNHFVNAADVVSAQADLLNLTAVAADTIALEVPLLKRAPLATYKANGFVPVRREGDRTLVVFADPGNKQQLDLA